MGEKLTPEEIIREGRELCGTASLYTAQLHRIARVILPVALDALEEATKATDQARRMYCECDADFATYAGRGIRRTARSVCVKHWPDAADRLFPKEGKR